MKKMFFALLGLSLMIVLSGCPGTTEQIVSYEEPEQEPQEFKRELDLWNSQFEVHYKDPISFFNEFEINTVPSKSSYTYEMDNGVVYRTPSSKLKFSVPAKTSGVISEMGNTTEGSINICFFEGSDTYVTFSKKANLFGFYADPKATVFVDGIPYRVEITIKGDGKPKEVGMCRLYFDMQDKDNPDNKTNIATGITPSGNKEIIVK